MAVGKMICECDFLLLLFILDLDILIYPESILCLHFS